MPNLALLYAAHAPCAVGQSALGLGFGGADSEIEPRVIRPGCLRAPSLLLRLPVVCCGRVANRRGKLARVCAAANF